MSRRARAAVDPRIELLLGGIDESFDRKGWHGPTLTGSVRGVPADEAAWRPARARHSIREIVVHCAYWKYIVRRRLSGDRGLRFPERGSDWFARPDKPDGAGWRSDRELLADQHAELRAFIAGLPADSLGPDEAGRGRASMIRGIAAHDVYHAGQIRLLRRLFPGAG